MIITRLTLNNFGVYAGINTFEFNSSKPVVLIGGMNGRGKTTFLEAVLLALYGANSFAYNESKYHTYGQYLKAYVNEADGTLKSFVELEFKLESETEERYLVRREWSGSGQRTKEKMSIKKDAVPNTFLTNNWSMFIENILPSGLSNIFFFDGEKIAELAAESTDTQMKESIKFLLGISVLDLLGNDISRIISRVTKKSQNQMQTKEMELLRDKKNQADNALKIADEYIAEISEKIEEANKKLEKARIEYTAKGGDIIVQRQDLFNQRNFLAVQAEQINEQLIGGATGELPLALVKSLLSQIYEQAEKEHEAKILSYAIQKMNAIFKSYAADRPESNTSVRAFINYVESQATNDGTEIVFDIPDQSLYQLKGLISSEIETVKEKTRLTMNESIRNQTRADEVDSYLSVDIDENALSRIYKKIKTLEQEIIDLEVSLEAEQKRRTSLHGDAIRATSEYSRFVESLLEKLELNDDGDRILKYSYQVNSILDEYKVRLQKKKIGVLAATMTICYKKLANKKNLIDRIDMDPVTLDFVYLNADGNMVPKESLSAGEKQLMVISLLWALAICSKKKLPVIIDTPLSRLDSNHRVSLITTYFPQASDQTIILSTDSEIDQHYYKIMKDNVGDKFTLVYDDEKKCSTIERGYFIGDIDDN
jgi:DNA sulfur modification protein DndD